jgi:hypothetical protein
MTLGMEGWPKVKNCGIAERRILILSTLLRTWLTREKGGFIVDFVATAALRPEGSAFIL